MKHHRTPPTQEIEVRPPRAAPPLHCFKSPKQARAERKANPAKRTQLEEHPRGPCRLLEAPGRADLFLLEHRDGAFTAIPKSLSGSLERFSDGVLLLVSATERPYLQPLPLDCFDIDFLIGEGKTVPVHVYLQQKEEGK